MVSVSKFVATYIYWFIHKFWYMYMKFYTIIMYSTKYVLGLYLLRLSFYTSLSHFLSDILWFLIFSFVIQTYDYFAYLTFDHLLAFL